MSCTSLTEAPETLGVARETRPPAPRSRAAWTASGIRTVQELLGHPDVYIHVNRGPAGVHSPAHRMLGA